MDRKISAVAVMALFLLPLLLPTVSAQNSEYDLIIVRNDDLIDYIVALPYSKHLDVPILPPVNPPQELDPATLAQLQSYEQFGWYHVLVIGDYQAISQRVQEQLMSLGFQVTRIGGETRVDTAAKLAEEFYPSGIDAVVLASASDYGSALAAARWAMAYDRPFLLTNPSNISQSVKDTLSRLKPETVILIGAGLSKNIEKELQAMGYSTYWLQENITISVPTSTVPEKTNWGGYVIGLLYLHSPLQFPLRCTTPKRSGPPTEFPSRF